MDDSPNAEAFAILARAAQSLRERAMREDPDVEIDHPVRVLGRAITAANGGAHDDAAWQALTALGIAEGRRMLGPDATDTEAWDAWQTSLAWTGRLGPHAAALERAAMRLPGDHPDIRDCVQHPLIVPLLEDAAAIARSGALLFHGQVLTDGTQLLEAIQLANGGSVGGTALAAWESVLESGGARFAARIANGSTPHRVGTARHAFARQGQAAEEFAPHAAALEAARGFLMDLIVRYHWTPSELGA